MLPCTNAHMFKCSRNRLYCTHPKVRRSHSAICIGIILGNFQRGNSWVPPLPAGCVCYNVQFKDRGRPPTSLKFMPSRGSFWQIYEFKDLHEWPASSRIGTQRVHAHTHIQTHSKSTVNAMPYIPCVCDISIFISRGHSYHGYTCTFRRQQ